MRLWFIIFFDTLNPKYLRLDDLKGFYLMESRKWHFLFVAFMAAGWHGECQNTVGALFRNDIRLGDQYYADKNFHDALEAYQRVKRNDPLSHDMDLRIARTWFSLKVYSQAVASYNSQVENNQELPLDDLFWYAEALLATSNNRKAADYYRQYLLQAPDNEMIAKKLWRLSNMDAFYEDSAHYHISQLSINTPLGDLCPVLYGANIVFMSNRKESAFVEYINASVNEPFYALYFSNVVYERDSVTGKRINTQYSKPVKFARELGSNFHIGPVDFYHADQKMIFVATATHADKRGGRTLQLFFAELKDKVWVVTQAFPYNSDQYSISSAAITRDGSTLYFSSDAPGGVGGKDLYQSSWINGQWTKPFNLGETINTSEDEVFPYIHNQTLYFSSNGHDGLGGLDLFRTEVISGKLNEPENAGYPVNSSGDDFGIVLDSLGSHGYFSSNRGQEGYHDDLYEVDIDLVQYPVVINGVLKIKEHTWSDSSGLKMLPKARIVLIDNLRKIPVKESTSDEHGNFSISIPYFSKYIMKVLEEDGDEYMTVLEIPRFKNELSSHEIVLIKDIFKEQENPEVK